MSTVTVHLSDPISLQVEEFARRDGVSIDEFLAMAAAEKVSALQAIDFFRKEGAKASKEDWDYVLSRVPVRPPLPGDELPDDLRAMLDRDASRAQ